MIESSENHRAVHRAMGRCEAEDELLVLKAALADVLANSVDGPLCMAEYATAEADRTVWHVCDSRLVAGLRQNGGVWEWACADHLFATAATAIIHLVTR